MNSLPVLTEEKESENTNLMLDNAGGAAEEKHRKNLKMKNQDVSTPYVLTSLQEYLIRNAIERKDIGKLKKLFYYMPSEGREYKERFLREPTIKNAKDLFRELCEAKSVED